MVTQTRRRLHQPVFASQVMLAAEIDGPMLRHGLQAHHNQPLMRLPHRRTDRPDPDRLAYRYHQFQAA